MGYYKVEHNFHIFPINKTLIYCMVACYFNIQGSRFSSRQTMYFMMKGLKVLSNSVTTSYRRRGRRDADFGRDGEVEEDVGMRMWGEAV